MQVGTGTGLYGDQTSANIQMNQMAAKNNMGMGMGMGLGMGLGLRMGNGIMNGTLVFRGDCMSAQSYLQNLNSSVQAQEPIHNAQLTITGNIVKQVNNCCLILTIVAGTCLIFPICFMCCSWWNKIVMQAYDVPLSTYKCLQIILAKGKVQVIELMVTDSAFSSQKAQYLYDLISRHSLKGFTFQNNASQNDFNDNQYKNFQANMKPFKSLPMMTNISWGTQIVL